jgi:transcriptional/translational regulatory protein YebC/TACO1
VDDDEEIIVYTDPKTLSEVRQKIVDAGLKVADAGLEYVPNNKIAPEDEEKQGKVLKLLEALDDLDDVVNVFTNADV